MMSVPDENWSIFATNRNFDLMKKGILISCLLMAALAITAQPKSNFITILPTDTPGEILVKAANIVPSERQLRWQKLELTAFFHFGLNTFTDREWGEGNEDPAIFNPETLDAEQWVVTVKEAGFKQVIITAKHHDGFCLWPTNTTSHSVKNSPWKNGHGDVVREVAEACRKHNMGFGVYLSPWDRNAQSYGSDAYNDFFTRQLDELLTQYGVVDEVWFDGACGEGKDGKKQIYDFLRWYKLIREKQPGAVIAVMGPDVRWVGTENGRGRETEWSVVPTDHFDLSAIAENSQQDPVYKPVKDLMDDDLGSRVKILSAKGLAWYPAETAVSIRPGWFWHENQNHQVKTPEELFDIYMTSVGRNGVLLLNIPPDRRGLIHERDVQNLKAFKTLLDQIFAVNLAKGSTINSSNGKGEMSMLDGDDQTFFTTNSKDDTTTILHLRFPEQTTVNLLSLQEHLTTGQRVEAFELEYKDGSGDWKKVTEGTTIGYKRLIRFIPVTTRELRLGITSSRLNPTVAELGLYWIGEIAR